MRKALSARTGESGSVGSGNTWARSSQRGDSKASHLSELERGFLHECQTLRAANDDLKRKLASFQREEDAEEEVEEKRKANPARAG